LDELLFIPAAISPHKLDRTPTPADARVEMLRAAIEREPEFCLDTLELQRPAPSYAVDTVEALRIRKPDAQFVYLIGEDNVARLSTWHRFAELSQMIQFAVLDLQGISSFTDYFVICSGTSEPHLKAIAGEIEERLRDEHGIRAVSVDGFPASQWIVLDYLQVIVHVFRREKREFYSLEDLWGDAPRVAWEPAETGASSTSA